MLTLPQSLGFADLVYFWPEQIPLEIRSSVLGGIKKTCVVATNTLQEKDSCVSGAAEGFALQTPVSLFAHKWKGGWRFLITTARLPEEIDP